jgi:hypothetical protein
VLSGAEADLDEIYHQIGESAGERLLLTLDRKLELLRTFPLPFTALRRCKCSASHGMPTVVRSQTTRATARALRERIEQFHSRFCEVSGVPGDDGKLMALRSGGDKTVERWDDDAGNVPLRFELSPNVCGAGVKAQDATFHAVAERHQPRAELCFAPARRESLDPAPHFTDGDRADVEAALVHTQPGDDLCIWLGFCRLTEHIRVNKVTHNSRNAESSVSLWETSNDDGHASSKSTSPWFGG